MTIEYDSNFKKRFKKSSKRIQMKLTEKLSLFAADKKHDLLNDHKLKGKYSGCRSINITGDIRAIYKEVSRNHFLFIEVGTHHQLYGK